MKRVAVLIALSLIACGKSSEKAEPAKEAKVDKPAETAKGGAVDPSKFGGACKQSFDCPQPEMFASCSVECQKPIGSEEPGYCQLRMLGMEGAKNCYGNHRGPESQHDTPAGKVPVMTWCDVNAGFYCNMGSHVCEAVKAAGAACKDNAECGKDGACDKGACVAAGAAGAAAVAGACDSKAFRKDGQCVARHADGEACKEADECLSFNCVGDGKTMQCKPAKPASCNLRG